MEKRKKITKKEEGMTEVEYKTYNYYGAEHEDVRAINPIYPDINTPRELYDALLKVWNRETCSPTMRANYTRENITAGQCTITALLFQDIFGGEVFVMPLSNGARHFYNVAQNRRIDLTSEQFGERAARLRYEDKEKADRAEFLSNADKLLRYTLLKEGLRRVTGCQITAKE